MVIDTALPMATALDLSNRVMKRRQLVKQFWTYTVCLGVVISALGYILSGDWIVVVAMDGALAAVGMIGTIYAFATIQANEPYNTSDSIFRSP